MMTRWLIFAVLMVLAACGPRGKLHLVRGTEVGDIRQIFVASNRVPRVANGVQFSSARGKALKFGRVDVSIPPTHVKGQVEWPRGQQADAARHFVVSAAWSYADQRAFVGALEAAPGGLDEVIVFVHGYNTNSSEATLRLAQMAHDFDAKVPVISFSWPSEAVPGGYAYDRDSVIYSRDALEELVLALTNARRVMLVAHSMGSQLVMETLRQISISGNGKALRQLSGVALISPDIDPEVFISQARRIHPFPEPFLLMTSARDKILDLSAWIAGRPRRLGTITTADEFEGLPIFVVDLTEFSEPSGSGHQTAFAAPRAIEWLRSYDEDN